MDILPKKNKSSAGIQEKSICPRKFDLEKAKKHEDTQVPEIIFKITDRLNRNLSTEGLYLKPGNKDKVLKLRSNPAKIDFDRQNLHDLTSLLKMILSEMKEPLLPKQIFETYSRTASESQVKEELFKLDPVRRETLDHLMRHMYRVSGKRHMNKMDRENMCTVWGPVIYYPLAKRSDAEKRKELFGTLMDIYNKQIYTEQCQHYLDQIKPSKKKRKSKSRAKITTNEEEEELEAKEHEDRDTEKKRKEEKLNYSTEGDKRLIVPSEELKIKENIGRDTDEKREEENENDSVEDDRGLFIEAEGLKVDDNGRSVTEEKREEKKENHFVEAGKGIIEELYVKENGGSVAEQKQEGEKEKDSSEEGKRLTGPSEELNIKRNEEHTIEEQYSEEKGKDFTRDEKTLENKEAKQNEPVEDTTGLIQEEKKNNSTEQIRELVPEINLKTKEESTST